MNALTIIDTAALTPETVFAPGGVEGILSKLENDVRAIPLDISTAEGREFVKSVAYKVARSKTALDDMGKELVAGIKAQAATIDAERRIIRDRLDALKNEVRNPVDAWEKAEADRVALHESALVFLAESGRFANPPSAETIRQRYENVRTACDRDWQEFKERADAAAYEAGATLGTMLAAAEQSERDAAELAELRRQKAEREAADRIAAEAAQRAEAEKKKEAQAEEARRQLAERIEREREEAAARAVANENRRIQEAHAAAESAKLKRENNTRHRHKIEGAAKASLIGLGFDDAAAEVIIRAISAELVAHVSITY